MARRSCELGIIITRLLFVFNLVFGCSTIHTSNENLKDSKQLLLRVAVPNSLVNDSLLVHRGVYSNDFQEYYFITSNKSFQNFNILMIHLENGVWSKPVKAWFNSEFDDHGLSFSPDGKSLFFSSTRPVEQKEVTSTWHLWRSDYQNGKWSAPKFIDIPNLRELLVSHPSVDQEGTLYFHASNPDYSEMAVYYSKIENGIYQNAVKIKFEGIKKGTCTPYVTNNGMHLFFAAIEKSLPIYFVKKEKDKWSSPYVLPNEVNQGSQANPFVTSDNKSLLFAKENSDSGEWIIEEIDLSTILKK